MHSSPQAFSGGRQADPLYRLDLIVRFAHEHIRHLGNEGLVARFVVSRATVLTIRYGRRRQRSVVTT